MISWNHERVLKHLLQGGTFGLNGDIGLSSHELHFQHEIINKITCVQPQTNVTNTHGSYGFRQVYRTMNNTLVDIKNDALRYFIIENFELSLVVELIVYGSKGKRQCWVKYNKESEGNNNNEGKLELGRLEFIVVVHTSIQKLSMGCISPATFMCKCNHTTFDKYILNKDVYDRINLNCIVKQVHMFHDCQVGKCKQKVGVVTKKKSYQEVHIQSMQPDHSTSLIYFENSFYSKS